MISRRSLTAAMLAAPGLSGLAAAEEPGLKVTVGLHMDWEQIPFELGQRAGVFQKRSSMLEVLYTRESGE